jgi:hypothetical protein
MADPSPDVRQPFRACSPAHEMPIPLRCQFQAVRQTRATNPASIAAMLNRAALVVRFKPPFVDWVNAADPNPTRAITLAEVNDENTVYLVEVEDLEQFEAWLTLNGLTLFEEVLYEWYTDPDLWPQDRSLAMFRKWCDFELHTLVRDTGGTALEDDEVDFED